MGSTEKPTISPGPKFAPGVNATNLDVSAEFKSTDWVSIADVGISVVPSVAL